jgi:hypothetical protein
MTDSESNEELLKVLEAHGRDFLNSFSLPSVSGKRKREPEEEKEEEEWSGIQMSSPSEDEAENGDINCYVVRPRLMYFKRISNTVMTTL